MRFFLLQKYILYFCSIMNIVLMGLYNVMYMCVVTFILICLSCRELAWEGPGGSMSYQTTHISLSPIRRGFAPGFVNYRKDALDSQSQVIKFTSCLPMVGGSLRVLRLLPPLKLVAMT